MPTDLPPPGWYPDPGGHAGSRWWDGSAWTAHVRAEGPSDDPPPLPDDVLPGPRPGSSWIGRAAVALLLVGLAATVVVGLGNDGDVDPEGPAVGEVQPGAEVPEPLSRTEVAQRRDDAGCETVVDGEPLEDRRHLDPGDAPPPDVLYPERPPHSGRHYGQLLPLPDGVAGAPIDERAVLHNMEHGSVVVWFDAGASAQSVRAWWEQTVRLGFTSAQGGAVYASPMPGDVDDPPGIALRAWGVAMDCERLDPVVANAFLVDHFGSHGIAPEANLSPYPDGSLRWSDGS